MGKLYLVLQNGRIFEGESLGADGETAGELVFTTNMTGYAETLTDPSYYGQIIVQTFPMIGNYGANDADAESRGVFASGYVVRHACDFPSDFRGGCTVDEFLKKHGVVGICGVDTRAVTAAVREAGVMNAKIVKNIDSLKDFGKYSIKNAVAAVCCAQKYTVAPVGAKKYSIALLDYGAKANIARCLAARGAEVTVLPHDTPADEILAGGFDGLALSNGPGDPKDNVYEIGQLALLAGRLPIFGVCLGHQLLALALGGETEKLKYGHRGGNQPVRDVRSGKVYITSQNHGYAVMRTRLPKNAAVSFENVNDGTIEGLEYPALNAFTVQFHPEAAGGPKDSEGLFDKFLELCGDVKCR